MRSVVKTAVGIIIFLTLTVSLRSEPASQLHPTDYVNDFAHVLDQATIAQLDNICQQIDQKAHAQIAVVTVRSLDGADVESYAVELFKQWGIGGKTSNRGVLVLVATEDHRYRIEVGYGLEPILPDGKVGGFGREAVPLLRQNDYSGAVSLMASRVAEVIAQDAGVQLTGLRPAAPAAREPDEGLSAGWVAIIFIVIVVLLATRLGRSFLLGFFLGGGGWGGRRSGWGGGGFGGGGWGGGGGGGFGGFGGGSSGGGGASGSW